MRVIESIVASDLLIDEPCRVKSIVNGNIRVTPRGQLIFEGICNGRIEIEPGGRAQVNGIVNGGVHHLAARE